MRLRAQIGIIAALLLAFGSNVAAHPLGNFSISQYSAIRIGKDAVEVKYIVDMAEIPTFQEIQETGLVPKDGDAGLKPYAMRRAETLRAGISLEVNGRPVELRRESHEIIFPEGAGGLPTLKIGVVYKGKLTAGRAGVQAISYRDDNFPGRAGWKEIIATPVGGVKLINSSVPEMDRSAQLADYPTDLLNSPPQVLKARVEFVPVAAVAASAARAKAQKVATAVKADAGIIANRPEHVDAPASAPTKRLSSAPAPLELRANQQATPKNSFTELIAAKQFGWSMILFALVIAAGLGAFHALEPGHGKTLVAAYLVGSRGTVKHALLLGLIVTAAHTAGVYLLGAITLYASNYIMPERLYPWLALSSGLMIMSVGLVLFVRQYRGKQIGHHHHHGHSHGHHHDHGHSYHHHDEHGDNHHHGLHSRHHHEGKQDVSLKQLLALGISGGVIPCPAALVVLLSAVSLHRIGFGLLLIVAFSIGLALVLVAIGILMVSAQRLMARFQMTGPVVTRWLPLTSSAFIFLFGITLTWQALFDSGLLGSNL